MRSLSLSKKNVKVVEPVNQVGHGFDNTNLLEGIRDTGGTWVLADATSTDNFAQAVIVAVIDADNFTISRGGDRVPATGHSYSVARRYWLGETVGTVTLTPPDNRQELFRPVSATEVDVVLKAFPSASTGGSTPITVPTALIGKIAQVGHGFLSVNENAPVTVNNSGVWVLASRTSGNQAVAMIRTIVDANNFEVTYSGEIESIAHGKTVGKTYWVGATAGSVIVGKPRSGIAQKAYTVISPDKLKVQLGPQEEIFKDTVIGMATPALHSAANPYSSGDTVTVTTDAYIYMAKADFPAGAFVPNDWDKVGIIDNAGRILVLEGRANGMLVSQNALRGSSPYPLFNTVSGSNYLKDATVFREATGLDYIALRATGTGTFVEVDWQELSIQSNAERVTDLEATVSGISNVYQTLQTKVAAVATGAGLTHGQAFSFNQANDFIQAIGIPATFHFASGRPYPLYYAANNDVGFFGGTAAVDLVPDAGCMLIIIPKESVTPSQELRVTTISSSGGGNRFIAAYSGSGLATPLPLTRGNLSNTGNDTHTRFFDIPAGTEDIYLYSSRQVILDVEVPNKAARWGAVLAGTKLAAAVQFAIQAGNYAHSSEVSLADANASVLGMGLNATWTTTNGRTLPKVWDSTNKIGVYGGDEATDPAVDGDALELVIPKESLQNDMVLDIMRAAEASGGGNKRVEVYFGNPRAGGAKLPPIRGNEVSNSLNVSSASWRVSTTPDSESNVTEDLHVLIMGQAIFALDIFKIPTTLAVVDHIVELRGGLQPATHNTGTLYNMGDKAFWLNKSWLSRRDGVSGVFYQPDWRESTVFGNTADIIKNELDLVEHADEIDTLRGAEAYPIYDPTSEVPIPKDTYMHEQINGRDYKSLQTIPASAGVPLGPFNASQWDDLSAQALSEGETTARRLERIMVEADKLDFNSLKNRPSVAGHNFKAVDFTTVAAGWVDIIVWDTLPAGTFDSYGADFIMYLQDAATGEFVTQRISLNGSFGAPIDEEHHFIAINGRVSTLTASVAGATYRVIQESDDPRSPIHLQVRTSTDGINYVGIAASQLSLDYAATTQVFPWTYYTPTGTERVLSEEITDRWDELNIYDGFNGGISAESIGSPMGLGSRLRFLGDKIEHYVGTSKTLESFADGTLISGSSGQTVTSQKDLYTTNATPDLIAVDTEFGNMHVAVSPNGMTFSADLQNSYSGAAVPGFASQTNSESMMFDVSTNVGVLLLGNVSATITLELVTGSGGGAFNITDSLGGVVRTGALPVPQVKGESFLIEVTLPDNGIINLARIGSGFIGIISAQWSLIESAVNKQDHLVLDLHSNSRAFGLPKPIDTGLTPFENGNLRAHPIDGRPQVYRLGDWSEIPTTRFKVNATSHIASYYADLLDGDYLAQGCEEAPRPADLTVVNNQYDYPTLLNIIDGSSSGSGVLARNFDTAFETSMRDNGFEWTTNYRHDVGLMYLWLHVGTTYDGTAGRWLVSLTRSGTDVTIASVSGGGGTITVPADKVIKYVFECEAGSSTAKLYVDGVFAFTVAKQANTSYAFGRWEITSGASGSTDEVGYILSTTLYSSNNPTVTLTRDEVESSASLIIPSSPLPVDVIVPKGTYAVGTTLTVSGNGDVLRAEADDPQSFDGQPSATIDGNISYTQTDFPRGNNWRSDSKKATTIHSKGNTLFITVDAAGVLQSRHGTYTGGITITSVGLPTGEYTIVPDDVAGHIFDITSTFIDCGALHDSENYNAVPAFLLGEPAVKVFNEAGVATDSAFSMILMW